MPYRKRYYKKNYKKRTLKKSNIFSKKSAKSQAKQIYALNKKINYINKMNRPETITKDWIMLTYNNIDPATLSDDYPAIFTEWHQHYYIYENGLLDDAGYTMTGNVLRPYNINIYGSFANEMYSLNYKPTGENNVYHYNVPLTGYLRIIVCKLSGGNQGKELGQITQPFTKDISQPDFGLISGPLVDDVSKSLKIIKNKVIKINDKNPIKNFRIKIKNPGAYQKGVSSSVSPPAYKNEYLIYIQYFCPDVLRLIKNQTLTRVAPYQYVKMACKMAFTDI